MYFFGTQRRIDIINWQWKPNNYILYGITNNQILYGNFWGLQMLSWVEPLDEGTKFGQSAMCSDSSSGFMPSCTNGVTGLCTVICIHLIYVHGLSIWTHPYAKLFDLHFCSIKYDYVGKSQHLEFAKRAASILRSLLCFRRVKTIPY